MSEYLKSAAELRKLAEKVSDPEAHRRIIAVAEEYEALAASQTEPPPRKPQLIRVRRQPSRGPQLH